MPESKAELRKNWFKAGLAFLYTKQGFQGYIVAFIVQYAQNLYSQILKSLGHPEGTRCTSCTIYNVLKCRTPGICSGTKTCTFHNIKDPKMTSNPCPLQICDSLRDALKASHRHTNPSFRNTTSEDWSTSSWEIAKCFMQYNGYKDVRTADQTDFSGLISIILNLVLFEGEFQEDLSRPNNIFVQARDIRNKVIHDANMEVHSKDVAVYINILIQVLSDPKGLQHTSEAQDAIRKLKELQNDEVNITDADEEMVRQEAIRALKETKERSLEELETEKSRCVNEVVGVADSAIMNIADKKQQVETAVLGMKSVAETATGALQSTSKEVIHSLTEVGAGIQKNMTSEHKRITTDMEDHSSHSMTRISQITSASISEIKGETKCGIQRLKDHLNKQRYVHKDELQEHGDRIKQIVEEVYNRTQGQHLQSETYATEKINLQKSLIVQYEDNFCMMPFSPLIQEEEIDVEKLFVMPTLRVVRHDLPRTYTGALNHTYIKTIKDLFHKDLRRVRRVYLQSDAGKGKTTICQMIIKTWCKVHSESTARELTPDEIFLKSFEFLFYLPLRSMTHLFHTTAMIKELLVREKYHNILDKVLKEDSDKCLLIMDGLDEWSAPLEDTPGKRKRLLPFIDPREEFTILTASRPWKLEVLRLKTSKIDQDIELTGLNEQTAEILVTKLVELLNQKFGRSKRMKPFMKEIRRRNLGHFLEMPFILMQIVCLWHDNKEFGNTQVEVYKNMVDCLLELAGDRFEEDELPSKEATNVILANVTKLAYKTLFRESAESLIVFPRSVTEPFGISKESIPFCLKIGLLSESKHMAFATTRTKRLSFLHKTFQEYFSAVFIASDKDVEDDMFNKLNNIPSIFEMERVLVFLSGLKPALTNKLISHTASKADIDRNFQEYRQSVSSPRFFQLEESVLHLQNLVIECISEGFRDDYNQLELVLGDVTTLDFENKFTAKHMAHLRLDSLRSVVAEHVEIPYLLPPLLATNVDTIVKLSCYVGSQDQLDGMKDVIELSQNSIQSLSICSSRFAKPSLEYGLNLGNLFQPVDSLRKLSCIEFERIDLTHQRILELMGFLTYKSNLRQILLCDIACKSCNHGECSYDIDLSTHCNIELLSLTSLFVNDVRVNASKLRSCNMSALQRPQSIISTLRSIRDSRRIESLIFSKHINVHEKYKESVEVLVEVLPTLKGLQHLTLKGVLLEQHQMMKCSHMVDLDYVALSKITMNLGDFQTFIDELPSSNEELEVLLNEFIIVPAESVAEAVKFVTDSGRFHILKNVSTDKSISLRLKQIVETEEDSDG